MKKSRSDYSDEAIMLSLFTKTKDYTASPDSCQEKGVYAHSIHNLGSTHFHRGSRQLPGPPTCIDEHRRAFRPPDRHLQLSRLTFTGLLSTMDSTRRMRASPSRPARSDVGPSPGFERGMNTKHPGPLIIRQFIHAAGPRTTHMIFSQFIPIHASRRYTNESS